MEILSTPGSYYSVHDDLIFTVRDLTKANDSATYPDYRYICDVYNGSDLVARLKAYPQPDSKIGIFNISNILRNYITPVFNPSTNFLAQTMGLGDFNASGTCVFGEEYDFVQYLNVSGDTGRRYFGHYNGRKIGVNTNLSAYYGKIASARPSRTSMYRSAGFHLVPYFQNSSTINYVVTQYNSSGGVVTTLSSNTSPSDFTMNMFNAGAIGGLNENTSYLTVDFGNGNIITIDIVCEPKYEVHTLHFLNRFGGFETKHFTKVSRKSIDIEKSEFGKLPYTISNAGVPEYYNSNKVYNETRSVFASQYKEKMILNTDNLSDAEYRWLADLMISPMVYMEMTSGSDVYFIPVIIAGSNYDFRKSVNDKITNLTINIEFGDQFNAQYR